MNQVQVQVTAPFTGTYKEADCIFLLNRLNYPEETTSNEKPGWEEAPQQAYLSLYEAALHENGAKLAQDVARLALHLAQQQDELCILVSLARAGTPYGILVQRALTLMGRPAIHYGVSLIKGWGVDPAALDYIRRLHPYGTIRFIDGWTGKGGISRELHRSVAEYNQSRSLNISSQLNVIADLAGTAGTAVNSDDYLIPSAPINATMNGLISKTFGQPCPDLPAPFCFHGTYMLEHLREADQSNSFIESISILLEEAIATEMFFFQPLLSASGKAAAQDTNLASMARLQASLEISNEDLIKHGYCETVRALQRRPMRSLLLRDPTSEANAALLALAETLDLPVIQDRHLHYECVGVCLA